jgi:hypothetical protein
MSRPYIRQEILEVAVFKISYFCKKINEISGHNPEISPPFFQEKFGSFWTVIAANFLNEYQKQCYEVMQQVIYFI